VTRNPLSALYVTVDVKYFIVYIRFFTASSLLHPISWFQTLSGLAVFEVPNTLFFLDPNTKCGNMADYQAQRQKNIEANRALLLSLGLEQLQNFAPAAVSVKPTTVVKPNPKPKPKPKAKEPAQKRKRDDADDSMSLDEGAKAPKLEGEDGQGPRRSARRGGKPSTYNEDELFEKKVVAEKKQRAIELEEDRTGRTGNRLGVRKHNP